MDAAKRRWNLLIITADDLNGDSTGWMGSTVGATPNLDSFAASCHQFRNCHVASPLCQPSRSALMTGLFPNRNGALGFEPVRSDVVTLTELLASHGYFTAAINKTAHMMPPEKFKWDLSFNGSGRNPAALRQQFEECLRATAGRPFFINANSTDPHGPFPSVSGPESADAGAVEMFQESKVVVPSFLENLPEVRREVAQYFSVVRRLDQSFGGLIDALKTADKLESTIVVFLSDHGMSMPYSKATLYRNATWSPVLLRVPGISQCVATSDMVSSVDIMPTLLDLLGLEKPDALDGNSWLPLLQPTQQPNRDHVFTQLDAIKSGKRYPSRCVRTKMSAYIWNEWSDGKERFGSGTTETRASWKAMIEAAEQDAALKSRVEHFVYRCPEEFYDEGSDPDERHNLIDDPKRQSEILAMKDLLLEHMEKTRDPLLREFRRAQKTGPKGPFSKFRRSKSSG